MTAPASEALRLVNGVLLPGFRGTEPPRWLLEAIDEGLAGVAYFAHNVPDAETAAALSAVLRARRADLVIASDEEGGEVTRLEAATGSSYPGNGALGAVGDPGTTERVARLIGRDLRRAGIGLNLAPDADVNADPRNPVIGVRSFGSEAPQVATHTAAYVRGLQSAGVAACAKHFPGHGDTAVDSHLGIPQLDADIALLRNRDLLPFAAAVAAGTRCLMTGHIRVLPFGEAPATLNPEVTRLAREELGFTGVIVTDALDMGAVARDPGFGAACVEAVRAGADLLCLGNPAEERDESEYATARDALLAALDSGRLTAERLADAGRRIRDLADWIGEAQAVRLPPEEPAESGLPLSVARAALRVRGDVRLASAPHLVDLRQQINHASGSRAPHLRRLLTEAMPGLTATGVTTEGPVAGRADAALLGAGERPLVLVVREPHRDPDQERLLRELVDRRPDSVVVLTGLPHAIPPEIRNLVITYGSGRVNAQAAVEQLLGCAP
ncbi:glycoside hydrolase family 3 N-terminal domain-containing protein [Streptomyces sp. 150FB]|uniref:glycoside hydrolase family 3 protein n=1 Tax=Streptomyces sp. 150FB TaxID=1576605 RepID=UPI000698B2AF|nr:glycoside hydrolase family 3 N-terminal domain-containing protein [Streptomyces sp. 150FB]